MSAVPVWCQFIWQHPVVHYPADLIHPLVLKPLPGYPHGYKGGVMREAWLQYRRRSPGIVFIDGDVAVDPWGIRAMNRAVLERPTDVLTGQAWLWPPSLRHEDPHLSHRTWRNGEAAWGHTHPDGQVDYITFNCTYIPNRLFERVDQQHDWHRLVFPWADTRLSEIAQQPPRIPMWYVPSVYVMHLNAW